MSVITIKRTPRKAARDRRSLILRSFRNVTRAYFAMEKRWEFAVEVALFVIIAAIASWPIFAVMNALKEFFRRTGI